MTLQLHGNPTIDNLLNYPAETVEKLRELLTAGAHAHLDPHRKDFYDVESGSRVFYVHLAPNGKVLLLATWQKPDPQASRSR